MSWFYRLIKRQPNASTSRSEGEIEFQGISNFGFDSNTTTATIKGITTLDIHTPTTVKLTHATTLDMPALTNLQFTAAATVLWVTQNVGILTGTASPWSTAGVTAGKGSIYLSTTTGSIYVKTSSGTLGWLSVAAYNA